MLQTHYLIIVKIAKYVVSFIGLCPVKGHSALFSNERGCLNHFDTLTSSLELRKKIAIDVHTTRDFV